MSEKPLYCTRCGHVKIKREVKNLESYDENTGNKIKEFRFFCTNSECMDYIDEAYFRAVTQKSRGPRRRDGFLVIL